MPRLLFVGSGNPWRGGAGYLVRQSLFLGALSQVADLHLAMFDCDPTNAPAHAKQLTALGSLKRTKGSRFSNLADDFLNPLPRMFRGYDLAHARRLVKDLKPESFDAIFSFRIDFGHFAGVLDHPRLILDIDDPEHVRGARRLAAMGGGDWRTERDLKMLANFERQTVAKAKLAFVCQENDQKGWAIEPEVVPNCVQIPPEPRRRASKHIVLFVGNCAGGVTTPNVDAVQYFLTQIWPIILTAVTNAEFHLVGATGDWLRKLAGESPRVQLRGFVDDLDAVYAESAVSIAPIRFGTGTRIKILEAFAHACPVISTLPGAEGIAAIPGNEIELASGASDFAELTIGLLQNGMRAEQIGRRGRQLAIAKYDAAAEQKILVNRFSAFLQEKAGK